MKLRWLEYTFTMMIAVASLHAQTFQCPPSLDSEIATAERVVVARVGVVGKSDKDIFGNGWVASTLDVMETIKGPKAERLQANLQDNLEPVRIEPEHKREAPEIAAERWQSQGERLLVIIQPARDDIKIPALATVVNLEEGPVEMWSGVDFNVLSGASAILLAARDEVARIPRGERFVAVTCMDKSRKSFAGTHLSEPMTRGLMIPLDARAAARALAVYHQEELVSYGDDSVRQAIHILEQYGAAQQAIPSDGGK